MYLYIYIYICIYVDIDIYDISEENIFSESLAPN